VTGAVTSSGAFFAMGFSGFRGFAELGRIAGFGVLACLVAMVTVLPALLILFGGRKLPKLQRDWIGRALVSLQWRALAWVVLVAAVILPLAGVPRFDSDYLALQPRDSEAARLERAMVARSDLSPQFAAFVVPSADDALALTDRLLGEDTVGEVHSIADIETLDLPSEFAAGFRSPAGRYAVYAYPADDVWAPDAQRAFLDAMQEIDPQVTGMPVLGSYMVERSKRALAITATLGAALVLLCVWIDFRDVRLAALGVVPTALTVTATLGLMYLFDLSFNPLNVMALPILLGITVDDGVHMVHRFVAERGDITRTLLGTGRSEVLTAATDVAAFGTLALSAHRGLASFGLLLSIGVVIALTVSVVVLPTLLLRFVPVKAEARTTPAAVPSWRSS
jgi:predicted exporter